MKDSDIRLTAEERACLRMWFRQAISVVEREEALQSRLIDMGIEQTKKESHRHPVSRRRTRRNLVNPHAKNLVLS